MNPEFETQDNFGLNCTFGIDCGILTMNIQTEKLQLVRMLIETEDKSILNQIKAIFEAQETKGDIWDEWDDEVRKDVEEAISELDRGEGISHEEVMQEFSKWRKK